MDLNELPFELEFKVYKKEINDIIDIDKITYNDTFKKQGVNFITKKMPKGDGSHIAGWSLILEKMAENISDSPLESMKQLNLK